MSELLDVFIGESRENLESASQEILHIQADSATSESVDKIFRDLHTIKGSSDLFDIKPLTRLAHAAEDLLDSVRANETDYSDEIGDLLLEALDQISTWFDELENRTHNVSLWKPISDELSAQLRSCIVDSEVNAPKLNDESTVTETCETTLNELSQCVSNLLNAFGPDSDIKLLAKTSTESLYIIEYKPDENCFFRGEDPINVALALPGLCAFDLVVPAFTDDTDVYSCNTSLIALGEASSDDIEQHMAYYDQQYTYTPFGRSALMSSCKDKLILNIKSINDNNLSDAFNEACDTGDTQILQSTASLLLASTTFPPTESATLEFLSKASDITVLAPNRHLQNVEKGTEKNSTSLVTENVKDDTLETLPSHTANLLSQQLEILKQEDYQHELMFPSIASVAGSILNRTFKNEADVTLAIEKALDAHSQSSMSTTMKSDNDPAKVDCASPNDPEEQALQPLKADRQVVKMLKVDQAKIDYLMDIVGELTVAKNSLPYLAKQAEEEGDSKKLSKQIKAHFSIVNRLTESLQSAVLQIRMVPVSHVFQRYPRLVRELARKLNKKIDLHMQGEDTEFDKNLIESLSEPLIHLLRNSIDHGIEAPHERIEIGKPETGRIELTATPMDDSVIIEIKDDGKGIDPQKIKLLAFQKGVISEAQLESIDDNDALQLIFSPGFSTSEEVSDLSGRGVGMDAVRTMVNQAGGTIEMNSDVGVGTVFRLLLPQTMSVNRVMMFEVNQQMFGVSMDSVVETVKVHTDDIQRIRNESVLVLRDKLIPLCSLRGVLGFDETIEKEEYSILIVSTPQGEFGLIIDKFHEGIDVIQKPLEGVLSGYPYFSGTALLGDGRVLLILNVPEVIVTCL